jgi:hypothetical protein
MGLLEKLKVKPRQIVNTICLGLKILIFPSLLDQNFYPVKGEKLKWLMRFGVLILGFSLDFEFWVW